MLLRGGVCGLVHNRHAHVELESIERHILGNSRKALGSDQGFSVLVIRDPVKGSIEVDARRVQVELVGIERTALGSHAEGDRLANGVLVSDDCVDIALAHDWDRRASAVDEFCLFPFGRAADDVQLDFHLENRIRVSISALWSRNRRTYVREPMVTCIQASVLTERDLRGTRTIDL